MRVYILLVVQKLYSTNDVQSKFNYVSCYRVSHSCYKTPVEDGFRLAEDFVKRLDVVW